MHNVQVKTFSSVAYSDTVPARLDAAVNKWLSDNPDIRIRGFHQSSSLQNTDDRNDPKLAITVTITHMPPA